MTSLNSCLESFPVVVVLECKEEDSEDFLHAINLLSNFGSREHGILKEIDPYVNRSLDDLLDYFHFGSVPEWERKNIFVEFENEAEARLALVMSSFTDKCLLAIRFRYEDKKHVKEIAYAMNKFLDASAKLACFEEDIGSYDYYAQEAGITGSNFKNWDGDASDVRKIVEAERELIEAHINAVLNDLRLKTE